MFDSHERLLAEWQERPHHKGEVFISDGMIDPERWEDSSKRSILFLLKEAYGEPDLSESWDLCSLIRDEWKGPKYKLWWTAAYWAYALQEYNSNRTPPFPAYDSVWGESGERPREALLCSSVVNIKKSRGKPSSDPEDIRNYVDLDGDLVVRQVGLLAPDIVVCGGTWDYVKGLWPGAVRVSERVLRVDEVPFVDFWHPANHYPNVLNYYGLCGIVQASDVFVSNRTDGGKLPR